MKNCTHFNFLFYALIVLFWESFTFAGRRFFPLQKHWVGELIRSSSKTCSGCRKIWRHHFYTKLLESCTVFSKVQGILLLLSLGRLNEFPKLRRARD